MIKHLKIKGRINRTELFAMTVVILILESITYLIWGKDSDIFLIISILLFVIYLMQCAKRYHDLNKWGINGFVWWIIPVLNLVYFFQLYFSNGTDTANKYGEPSTFKIKNAKKDTEITEEAEEEKIVEEIIEYKEGEFDVRKFPEEDRNKSFYFYKYLQPNGEWINIDDIICQIRIGEYFGSRFKSGSVLATKSGVLEQTLKEDDLLKDKTIFYKIHNRGVYKLENSIENTEYKDYFKEADKSYKLDNWLVNDGEFVNFGDPVYKFTGMKYGEFTEHINYSKKTGFIHRVFSGHSIGKIELMYIIRESDAQRVEQKYINEPKIIIDDFTNSTIIKWQKVSSKYTGSQGVITKSDNSIVDFLFSFNYINNNDFIVFQFNPKQISPKQFDKVLFLFENGEQIEFELTTNPISFKDDENRRILEYRGIITKSELELFASTKFKKWKISLMGDKREVLGGIISGNDFYLGKNNIQIVIKKFANDYIDIVKKKIPNHKPLEFKQDEQINDISNDYCFVYLMHDTTNGYYKIGISNNPQYRERTLQSEKPTIEKIISKKFPVREMAETIEKALHDMYSEKRLRGEWFELDMKDVEIIKETLK